MAVYQHVYKKLEYDPIQDFAAVSQLATFDFAVAVGPQVPATSLKELVAWMKADASRASFGSPGAGTLPHFFGLLFGRAAGVELRHVPYKGSAATRDRPRRPVMCRWCSRRISDFVEMHKAKRIRILATSGAERSPFVPDVPTFREAGFDIQGTSWFGAFAPARTPARDGRPLQRDHGRARCACRRSGSGSWAAACSPPAPRRRSLRRSRRRIPNAGRRR